MPLVIIKTKHPGLIVEKITKEEWKYLLTLKVWKKENPKIWEQIKSYVYRRNLNKKPSEHIFRARFPEEEEKHPIFG